MTNELLVNVAALVSAEVETMSPCMYNKKSLCTTKRMQEGDFATSYTTKQEA